MKKVESIISMARATGDKGVNDDIDDIDDDDIDDDDET